MCVRTGDPSPVQGGGGWTSSPLQVPNLRGLARTAGTVLPVLPIPVTTIQKGVEGPKIISAVGSREEQSKRNYLRTELNLNAVMTGDGTVVDTGHKYTKAVLEAAADHEAEVVVGAEVKGNLQGDDNIWSCRLSLSWARRYNSRLL